MLSNTKNDSCQLTWVEPEILVLDVSETFALPNRGADLGRFADCTRS